MKNQRTGTFQSPEEEPEGGHQGSRRPGGAPEFSSVRWKMMKEDLGVSNAQAWGCPCAPPMNIQGDSSVYAWGCPRASATSSTIISSSLVPLYFYDFMRYVLCLEHLALY